MGMRLVSISENEFQFWCAFFLMYGLCLPLHRIMPVQTTDEDIIKSPQDERQYRLGNDLGMGMGRDVSRDL